MAVMKGDGRPMLSVDFSPDGKLIPSSELSGLTRFYNAATRGPQGPPARIEGKTAPAQSGPNGDWFSVAIPCGIFRRRDMMTILPHGPVTEFWKEYDAKNATAPK